MIRIVPLDFIGQLPMIVPADPALHDRVVEFCRRELKEEITLTDLAKVWVAQEQETKEIRGVFGYVLVPDVPLCRATDETALRMLADRYNDFLADNGARGKHTFIHVARNEKPECRCPGWAEVLRDWGAKLADRVEVIVR